MEVLNPNLTPLSAFETLELVRELKSTQERVYGDFEAAVADPNSAQTFSHADRQHLNPDNVQQLITPFIAHFESEHLPQTRQTPAAVGALLAQLRGRFGQAGGRQTGLTKAERLQICDLAPTEVVEIYLIVEECDSRFSEEEIEEILSLVRTSLATDRHLTGAGSNGRPKHGPGHVNGIDHAEEDEGMEVDLGDVDGDDDLVAEAREGGVPADQELDEVPD